MTNAMLFIKSIVHHVHGITLAKPKDHLAPEERNIGNTKQCAKCSNVAKHAWTFDHIIDFDNATIIDKGNNHMRKTLEL